MEQFCGDIGPSHAFGCRAYNVRTVEQTDGQHSHPAEDVDASIEKRIHHHRHGAGEDYSLVRQKKIKDPPNVIPASSSSVSREADADFKELTTGTFL